MSSQLSPLLSHLPKTKQNVAVTLAWQRTRQIEWLGRMQAVGQTLQRGGLGCPSQREGLPCPSPPRWPWQEQHIPAAYSSIRDSEG